MPVRHAIDIRLEFSTPSIPYLRQKDDYQNYALVMRADTDQNIIAAPHADTELSSTQLQRTVLMIVLDKDESLRACARRNTWKVS